MKTVRFFNGKTIDIDDSKAELVMRFLRDGVEYIELEGRMHSRHDIRAVESAASQTGRYKTPAELGMPDLGTDDLLSERQRARLVAPNDQDGLWSAQLGSGA